MDHHFPWEPVPSHMVGKQISAVVVSTGDHIFMAGAKQLVRGDFGLSSGTFAMHCWKVASVQPGVVFLERTPHALIVDVPTPKASDLCKVAELCAGIGGTTAGAVACGLLPLFAVDKTSLSCSLLERNLMPSVELADLQLPESLGLVHQKHATSRFGLLCGFPCQPFSTLGHATGFGDRRAWTFFSVLDFAYLTQASFLLLECVVGAGTHGLVQSSIQAFCHARKFRCITAVLHLDNALPCHRTRWWCLLVPEWLPEFSIPDLPVGFDFPTIGSVFPTWPCWPLEEEQQLSLDLMELDAFANPDYRTGETSRVLNMTGKCPTLLHSMGNQLRDCPCGCRGPLSDGLLRSQGLLGVLVQSAWPEVGLRHLHPLEAACLVGLPSSFDYGTDLRAALTQVGQIASPIQSHWMLLHLKVMLGLIELEEVEPLHHAFVRKHVMDFQFKWATLDMYFPRDLTLLFSQDACVSIKICEPVTLSQILIAEAQLGHDLSQSFVTQDGVRLYGPSLVGGSNLVLEFQEGHGFLLLDLETHGLNELTMSRWGTFLASRAGLLPEQFLSPLQLPFLLSTWPSMGISCVAENCPAGGLYVGLLLCDSHWICFVLRQSSACLQVDWFDGFRHPCPSLLIQLAQIFLQAWGCDDMELTLHITVPQVNGSHCGALALLNMGLAVGLWTSFDHDDARTVFQVLLDHQFHEGYGPVDEETILTWLTDFLPSKGVAVDQAAARAQQALKKLGIEPLKKAIRDKDPWRALKGLGNSLGKPFQWVQYEELQRHIQAREQTNFKTKPGAKAARAKPRSHTQSVALSPETLELYPTTFVDSDDMVVPPITLQEVTSNARGICVVTTDQALQLGDVSSSLSTDALAVVSIGELPVLRADHQTTLQWPAFYVPTREPVLVKGTLLNLGDDVVSIAKVDDAPAVASLDTEVLRVMVCRDVFDKDWLAFSQGPIKQVIALLPALQACPEVDCPGQCKYFHAAIDEEVRNPVLDVWAWKWMAGENKPVKPDKAETFTAFIRIPLSAVQAVLQLSGWHGIFLEPRPASKQGAHPGYAVIWLPKAMNLANALELKRKHEVVLGVARLAQKLGLRCLKKHEETLSAAIYPGKDLALCTVQTIYEVGPLPHGLAHAQVGQLLKAWNWLAKPMRPNRSSDAGQFWDIGTSHAPPAAILHTEQGSVTVTLKKDKTPSAKAAPRIEASLRTKKHMMTAPASSKAVSSQDPWLQNDPWGGYKANASSDQTDEAGQEVIFTDGRSGNSQAAQSKLSAMEERIMGQLHKRLAELPPPGLEPAANAQLQTEITELQEQNKKFEAWFTDVGTRFCGVDAKLNAQQTRLEELSSAMHEAHSATQTLQRDFHAMSTTFRTELQASLASQTDALSNKLEALIEKRMRTSWLFGLPKGIGACLSVYPLVRWLFWFILVFLIPFADGFRFGEALHPGPCHSSFDVGSHPFDDGYRIALGTANVAGLSNKVSVVMDLPPGIWGLTETHLTAPGFRAVRKAFRAESKQHDRNLRLAFGAPAPSRSLGSVAGTWTGVCTVSDYPSQVLPVTLSDDVYHSARALISSHHVGHINLVVGTVYGVAQSPTYRDPLAATRSILQAVSHQIVDQCRGPRCILGDFNCDVMQFPEMLYWHSLGWRELQQHRLATCSHPIEATCKSSTFRDFVWCSPELLDFLESTSVLHGVFPDHSAVCGFFRFPGTVPVSCYWPTPKPIPWEHVNHLAWSRFVDLTWSPFEWKGNPTQAFARWSSKVEDSLNGFIHVPHAMLPPGCKGRGQHLAPKKAPISQPKIKASRPGEQDLQCTFPNKTLLKWYRQLRRLQSLLHSLRKGTSNPPSWSYQAHCWASILRATGFGSSFVDWWRDRPIRLQSSPTCLLGLPSLSQMENVFEDFRLNYRHLEGWTQRQGAKLAQKKRETSLKVLFREFRPDPPETLDFLTKTSTIQVLEVDPASDTVLVDCSPERLTGLWNLQQEQVQPQVVSIEHRNDALTRCWCRFDSDTVPIPGHQLVQEQSLTQVPDIHEELIGFWRSRWQIMSEVSAPDWTRIFDFVRAHVPQHHLAPCPLSVDAIRMVFRNTQALQTGGPDGWRREDVKSLPDDMLHDLVALYEAVESGMPWPTQLTRGHVFCLQKTPRKHDVANYRPVVLFSLLYRLWGNMRARHYLTQMERLASFPAFGFLKGRSCMDLTASIQTTIEAALKTGGHVVGALFDIVKCFNNIPRAPIMFLAAWFGMEPGVITAWSSFLDSMHRSFLVHQVPSASQLSDTGLPEGDSMSCVGMVLLTFSFHYYCQHFQPNITAMSYVDNLELIAGTPGSLAAGIVTVRTWIESFCMSLDDRKSACWAATAADRKSLSVLGLSVIEGGLDLGTTMVYGSRLRNAPLQDRIKSVAPFWTRLRMLRLSLWHKLLVVRQALLPRALYASELTFLGDHWFVKLRSQIMKALKFDRAGANPIIRLGFVCGLTLDPAYHDAWKTLRLMVQSWQSNSQVLRSWVEYCSNLTGRPTYGPFAKMMRLLAFLNWRLRTVDEIEILPGVWFSLQHGDLRVLRTLFDHFWRQRMTAFVRHRDCFSDLHGINFKVSFAPRNSLGHAKLELLHCIQDGTFFLQTSKAKYDPSISELCPCGKDLDSIPHRALHCPRYAGVQLKFVDVRRMWHALPVVMTHHGLCPSNDLQERYWQELARIPWEHPPWARQPTCGGFQQIFTDGSGACPTVPAHGLAAWCVVSVELGGPVAAGFLPGVIHNSNRAEVWGLVVAVQWLTDCNSDGIIHVDSAYACGGAQFLAATLTVPCDWDNRDLWECLADSLRKHPGDVSFRKVAAHVNAETAEDSRSSSEAYWNGVADTGAKTARLTEPDRQLRLCWEQLQSVHKWQLHWTMRCQDFLLSLGERSFELNSESPCIDAELGEFVLSDPQVYNNPKEWIDLFPIDIAGALQSSPAIQAFGHSLCLKFSHWLLKLEDQADFLRPITLLEFYVGFYFDLGLDLPVEVLGRNSERTWVMPSRTEIGDLSGRTLQSRLAVFRVLVGLIFEQMNLPSQWLSLANPTLGIHKQLDGLVVPWPVPLAQRVVQAVTAFTHTRPIRHVRDLARAWP